MTNISGSSGPKPLETALREHIEALKAHANVDGSAPADEREKSKLQVTQTANALRESIDTHKPKSDEYRKEIHDLLGKEAGLGSFDYLAIQESLIALENKSGRVSDSHNPLATHEMFDKLSSWAPPTEVSATDNSAKLDAAETNKLARSWVTEQLGTKKEEATKERDEASRLLKIQDDQKFGNELANSSVQSLRTIAGDPQTMRASLAQRRSDAEATLRNVSSVQRRFLPVLAALHPQNDPNEVQFLGAVIRGDATQREAAFAKLTTRQRQSVGRKLTTDFAPALENLSKLQPAREALAAGDLKKAETEYRKVVEEKTTQPKPEGYDEHAEVKPGQIKSDDARLQQEPELQRAVKDYERLLDEHDRLDSAESKDLLALIHSGAPIEYLLLIFGLKMNNRMERILKAQMAEQAVQDRFRQHAQQIDRLKIKKEDAVGNSKSSLETLTMKLNELSSYGNQLEDTNTKITQIQGEQQQTKANRDELKRVEEHGNPADRVGELDALLKQVFGEQSSKHLGKEPAAKLEALQSKIPQQLDDVDARLNSAKKARAQAQDEIEGISRAVIPAKAQADFSAMRIQDRLDATVDHLQQQIGTQQKQLAEQTADLDQTEPIPMAQFGMKSKSEIEMTQYIAYSQDMYKQMIEMTSSLVKSIFDMLATLRRNIT